MDSPTLKKIGDLEALEVDRGSERTIIMLHGYGANAFDLFSLSDWPGLNHFNWVFPQAPLPLDERFPQMSRAWFPIDMEAFQIAIATGQAREFKKEKLEHFEESKLQMLSLLKELNREPHQMILGGFSQGSMMAAELALSSEKSLHSLCLFSSAYLENAGWENLIEQQPKLPVFQSHGTQDPILSFDQAKKLFALFQKSNRKCQFKSFNDGHTIPARVLDLWFQFLKETNA